MKNLGYIIIAIGSSLNAIQSENIILGIFATIIIMVGTWIVDYEVFNKED